MKSILYFIYYIKNTPKKRLKEFAEFTSTKFNKSKFSIYVDMLKSSFQYKISFLDYFYFEFADKDNNEREKWAGTGFMYEYQLKMNPNDSRDILEDKIKFLNNYSQFINRTWCDLASFDEKKELVEKILSNGSGKIVVKGSKGQVGAEVQVLDASKYNFDTLRQFMKDNDYDLLEEAVVQHDDLMKMSPSGLNTVRVITQINRTGSIEVLAARLRVSVNSPVDNMGAGNFAVALDEKTGRVISNGIYSDITKEDITKHPVTGVTIRDFQVPNWELVLQLANEAALLHPNNKSIGWDIAVLDDKVDLIEGNHNWCKLLYQLPVNKGLKSELVKFL